MYFLAREVCEASGVLKVIKFLNSIMNIVFIIAPIVLILMVTIDIAKSVMANDEEGMRKKKNLAIKRIILCMVLLCVPTLVRTTFSLVEDLTSSVFQTYNTCLSNMENISYYEEIEEVRRKQEEEAEEKALAMIGQERVVSVNSKTAYAPSDTSTDTTTDESSGESFIGKTYQLSEHELKTIAHVCQEEQGNNSDGITAEATLIANRYELYGKDFKSIYDYVIRSGWFAAANEADPNQASDKGIAGVTMVLEKGQRVFPLYVDDHDCWDCNSKEKYRFPQGYKGDICSLDNNGNKLTGLKEIKNRDNYQKGITKIYNSYEDTNEYYTFYDWATSYSDPFGYTPGAYKKIKGTSDS